jgi:uncharacterized membrane protein
MIPSSLQPAPGTKHTFRNRLISGTLVIIPFLVTLQILEWILGLGAGFMRPLVMAVLSILAGTRFVKTIPDMYIDLIVSTVSLGLLVGLIYLIGTITQIVAGRKVIEWSEALMLRIPLVRSIYGAAKQVIGAFSVPSQNGFRSVVLIEFPRPGFKAFGFITGIIKDQDGNAYAKVFVPTSPNPTTGFFELIPTGEVVHVDMPYEEAFKMIISGGIISPEELRTSPAPARPFGEPGSQGEATRQHS